MTDTDLLTIPDVMTMLNVSESTVRAMIRGKRPRLPYLRIGCGRGLIRFHRDDVRRYLDRARVERAAGAGADREARLGAEVRVIILVSGATRTVARYPQLGRWISPRTGNSIEEVANSGRWWAADNDAFKAWDAGRYRAMIAKIARADRSRLLWVACPDVVGDARATVTRWHEWYPRLESLGLPTAFVGQDDLESIPEKVPWDDMAAFFVGGDDRWKLSLMAERFIIEAKARGKWVHIGRVNSRKRIRHMIEIGADSMDGRSYSAWPEVRIPEGLRWIAQAEQQGHFLGHRRSSPCEDQHPP